MRRILTVDDSASVRKLIRIHLHGLGCSIAEAGNGAEALKCLSQAKYDLVIADLTMPVMNGIVMLRMKDAMHDTTPVIVLTAEVSAELDTAMANPCVMDYVKKPLDANELRVAVTQVLSLTDDDAAAT
jgi:two-component system chemotaxis response regulator CheY